jgi:two-component system CheB/CheR fusion protein
MKRRPAKERVEKKKAPAAAARRAGPGDGADARCPIVGIGASAGGLQAFRELLEHLPEGTKVAYVLIPHLDPRHESLMPSILAKVTPMPVEEAKEGTQLEADHVYVLAPNTTVTVRDGALHTVPRDAARKFDCIDHFLISLAEDCRDRAVGVLLSGTASDGTAGLGAIKAEGGITFAQDESAQFPEMPRNAIAAGYVDFVLSPKGIAEELARVARHPYLAHPQFPTPAEATLPHAPGPDDTDLDKILRLLRNAKGVEFSGYKRTTIERRIQRRMALRRLSNLKEYLRHLEQDRDELRALHDELLITVTSFFRDPEAFESVKTAVYPAILKNRAPQDPIRIWVPGCASGEEAYSLAIALQEVQEQLGTSIPVQIFATDVSETAIEKARAGLYENGVLADVSPERLRRFFLKNERGNGYQVVKSLRDVIVFARQDLTRDPPFSRLDLLSCRNVLIYLGPGLQKRAIPLFHYALNPRGFLFLGSSESVDRWKELFRPIDKKWKISAKIPLAGGAAHFDFGERFRSLDLSFPKKEERPGAVEYDVQREADRALLARFAPAGVVIDEESRVVDVRGETGPYLRPAPGKPSFSLYKMARGELAVELDSAVREAKKSGARVIRERVRLKTEDGLREIQVEVLPLKAPSSAPRHYAVLFEEAAPLVETAPRKGRKEREPALRPETRDREIARLEEELRLNIDYQQSATERLEAANEELRSANEEILSSNEELQSTNEELETSKEELQSANEELNTVNDELRHRNQELGLLTGDLTNVLSSTQIPIAIVDGTLRLRRITTAAEKLLNVIQSDVGRKLTAFKLNVSVPNLEETLLAVTETLTPVEQEVQDTTGRWWSLRVRPYRTLDQKIDGAVIVFVDIEAQKRAQKEIEEGRDFSESIVAAMPHPLLVLDGDMRVQRASLSFYETFRVTKEETEHRLLYDLGDGSWDIPKLRKLLEDAMQKDVPFRELELERDFPEIGRRTLQLEGRRVRFQSGTLRILLLRIYDVTERREREERERLLGEFSARLATSLDTAHIVAGLAELSVPRVADWCVIDTVGEDGLIHRVAAAPAEPAKRAGVSLTKVVGRVQDPAKEAGVHRVLVTGKAAIYPDIAATDLESLSYDKDHLRVLREIGVRSAMVVPLRVGARSLGAILFARTAASGRYRPEDLAFAEEWVRRAAVALENARLFGEAQEAIRSRERLLAVASHELKTPLTAFDLQVRLLLEGRHPDPCPLSTLRKSFEMLARQTEKFSSLIDQLLDLARAEGGKFEFQDAEVDLEAVWKEAVGRFRDALALAGSRVDIRTDGPTVGRFDRLRMHQVATNLISNAVKYGQGKPIDVSVEAVDGRARVVVRDRGIGIAKEDQAKLFERFERAPAARRYSGGLGLGLYIARRIVGHYGGSIRVDSTPGEGATFTVELPLGSGAHAQSAPAEGPKEGA